MNLTLHHLRLSALAVLLLLSSCSFIEGINSALPDNRNDYQHSRTLPPLEVPPTLNSDNIVDDFKVDSTRLSEYQEQQNSEVQPRATAISTTPQMQQESVKLQLRRDGSLRWIAADYAPEKLWDGVKQFWRDAGYVLQVVERDKGLLETDWLEKEGERIKFRVRIEPGYISDTSEIFLSRRSEKEIDESDTYVYRISWEPLPADPVKEESTLRTLLSYLVTVENQGQLGTVLASTDDDMTTSASSNTKVGQLDKTADGLALRLKENQQRSWRMVGLALDRAGFTIEDRNRHEGEYQIRYIDPDKKGKKKGFWSGLFGGGDDKAAKPEDFYYLRLTETVDETLVHIINDKGNVDSSATAERMLSLIQNQLR